MRYNITADVSKAKKSMDSLLRYVYSHPSEYDVQYEFIVSSQHPKRFEVDLEWQVMDEYEQVVACSDEGFDTETI